jgi:tRNA pseudouridine55 synthase
MQADGFVNVLKPPGMTSHDVVAWVRRCSGAARAGHLGTLDPAAAGVLPVCLGRATRLFRFAGGDEKVYRAEIVFGTRTDTMDAEGKVVSQVDSSGLTEAGLRRILDSSVGQREQAPPPFSAAKVGGRALHKHARSGVMARGRPKPVTVLSLDLVEFVSGPGAHAVLDITCSPGTYVRVLADDMGQAAGCGAYVAFLVRTRAGRFELGDALTLEEMAEAGDECELRARVLPLDWPLAHLPELGLEAPAARTFVSGSRVFAGIEAAWPMRVYGPSRLFLGLGEVLGEGQLQPRVVLSEGPAGTT